MFAILLLAHCIEELAGVGEAFHLQTAVFELVGQRLARQLVAFQYGHAAALEGGTRQVFGVVAGLGQGQGDPELGAFARGAVDADLAAHPFDQALGNHQAEAGATGLAFFVYVLVNGGMISGLLPVVGVPMPLISYGGTSAVTLLAGFGIVMSVHAHR